MRLRFVQPYIARILLFAWFHLDIIDTRIQNLLKPGPPKGHYFGGYSMVLWDSFLYGFTG